VLFISILMPPPPTAGMTVALDCSSGTPLLEEGGFVKMGLRRIPDVTLLASWQHANRLRSVHCAT